MATEEVSEYYVHTMQHIIGVGYTRCEEARENNGDLLDACSRWWNSLDAFGLMIGNLAKATGELCYLNIAVGNHKRLLADYIREHLGFCPILDIDLDGKPRNDKVPGEWSTLKYKFCFQTNS